MSSRLPSEDIKQVIDMLNRKVPQTPLSEIVDLLEQSISKIVKLESFRQAALSERAAGKHNFSHDVYGK